jgi:hypothetical protein
MSEKKLPRYAIVDIDGTIADVRHRLHHIKGPGRKNWKRFFEEMDRDQPIASMVDYVRELAADHTILIVTGRPETYRPQTERWLRDHDVPYEKLYMRRNGDHRPDYEAKTAVLQEIPAGQIAIAIDDRPPVCAMWEAHGIRCMKVNSDQESQEINELYRDKAGSIKKR